MVALALLCRWLPLPSCCGGCCACLLLWWGREEENEVLLPHLAEMVAPALQVVVAVAFNRWWLVVVVSPVVWLPLSPLVVVALSSLWLVVCGWVALAMLGRGRLPWFFFESPQSGTTVERDILRVVKDTPCYHSTHTTTKQTQHAQA